MRHVKHARIQILLVKFLELYYQSLGTSFQPERYWCLTEWVVFSVSIGSLTKSHGTLTKYPTFLGRSHSISQVT